VPNEFANESTRSQCGRCGETRQTTDAALSEASCQESVSNGFPPGVRHRNGTFQETSEFGVSFIYTGIGSSSRILNDNGFQLFDANEYWRTTQKLYLERIRLKCFIHREGFMQAEATGSEGSNNEASWAAPGHLSFVSQKHKSRVCSAFRLLCEVAHVGQTVMLWPVGPFSNIRQGECARLCCPQAVENAFLIFAHPVCRWLRL